MEDSRDSWGWVDRVGRDLRHAVRSVLRRPGYLITTTVTLALGIGLTSFMFSVVYSVIVRGLPFDDAEDLFAVSPYRTAERRLALLAVHDFMDWSARQTGFEEFAAFYLETVNISHTGQRPIRLQGMHFSEGLLRAFRFAPVIGRGFLPEEDHPSAPPVMLQSYRAWQDQFGGDANVLGRTVRANRQITTIVGVMPEGFDFPAQTDAWLPLRLDPLATPRGEGRALTPASPPTCLSRSHAGCTGWGGPTTPSRSRFATSSGTRQAWLTGWRIGPEEAGVSSTG